MNFHIFRDELKDQILRLFYIGKCTNLYAAGKVGMDSDNWRTAQGQIFHGEAAAAGGLEGGDWRTRLPQDTRQRMLNKMTETVTRHLSFYGEEGIEVLKDVAVRSEEQIYTAATSQSDYLRKISLYLSTMEASVDSLLPYLNYRLQQIEEEHDRFSIRILKQLCQQQQILKENLHRQVQIELQLHLQQQNFQSQSRQQMMVTTAYVVFVFLALILVMW